MNSHRRRLHVAALLLSATFVFASCGTDDKSDGATGPPLDEAAFVEGFSERCTAVGDELKALGAEGGEPASYQDLADQLRAASAIFERGVADLNELRPPDELADTVDEGLGLLAENAVRLGQAADAAESEDDAALEELGADAQRVQDEAQAVIEGLGITCGFGDS